MVRRFPLLVQLVAVTALLMSGCGSEEDVVNPADRLCGGESAFGARITGGGETVDVCLADGKVNAVLTQDGYYEVVATLQAGGKTHELRMTFPDRDDSAPLSLTGNLSLALSNPEFAWIFYEETPDGGNALESNTITGGTLLLGFSGQSVVAGTLTGVTMTMRDAQSQTEAGTRSVPEGFFSISVTPQLQSP